MSSIISEFGIVKDVFVNSVIMENTIVSLPLFGEKIVSMADLGITMDVGANDSSSRFTSAKFGAFSDDDFSTAIPEFINDNKEPKIGLILAGVISQMQKKTFTRKKGKREGEEGVYYSFVLDDGKKIECIYFCPKSNIKKINCKKSIKAYKKRKCYFSRCFIDRCTNRAFLKKI